MQSLVKLLKVEVSPKAFIAVVTLNNPSTRNSLTERMGNEFTSLIRSDVMCDPLIRSVVLTGEGTAFSAGGDVNFLRNRLSDTVDGNIRAMRSFYQKFLVVREIPVPVVAALNGHAIGAGFCVALACDIRVALSQGKYSVNFTQLGIHPGMGATYFLPRLIGESKAHKMLLTGEQIDGQQSVDLGIAAKCFSQPQEVVDSAMNIARSIAMASSVAVRETVKTFRLEDRGALERALQRESEAQAVCYGEKMDLDEALNALAAKREPKFV